MKSIALEKSLSRVSKICVDIFCITACFINGRIIQYFVFDLSSLYYPRKAHTILWIAMTGFVMGAVVLGLKEFVSKLNRTLSAKILTAALSVVALLLFNFFVPLTFPTDITRLMLRTMVDFGAVTVGMLLLPVPVRPRGRKEFRWIVK